MFINEILIQTLCNRQTIKIRCVREQKLSKTKALAILSSDALSSVAYGPEQILIVLMTVGTMAFWYSLPIAAEWLFYSWH